MPSIPQKLTQNSYGHMDLLLYQMSLVHRPINGRKKMVIRVATIMWCNVLLKKNFPHSINNVGMFLNRGAFCLDEGASGEDRLWIGWVQNSPHLQNLNDPFSLSPPDRFKAVLTWGQSVAYEVAVSSLWNKWHKAQRFMTIVPVDLRIWVFLVFLVKSYTQGMLCYWSNHS